MINSGRVDGLTDIETPHVFQAPPIVLTSKYPHHVVHEGNSVRAPKTVGREHAPNWSLALVHNGRLRGLDILHIREAGNRTEARRRRLVWRGVTGVAESDVELALGVVIWNLEAARGGGARWGVARGRATRCRLRAWGARGGARGA